MLAFPEPGLDDTASYQGYQTRFYRDSKQNTVQIYLEPRGGRAVLVWADAVNESAGFTIRDSRGRPARVAWGAEAAYLADSGESRTVQYRLTASAPRVHLGWFLLGSMRVERDFVYAERHLRPYSAAPFVVAEESLLVAGLARLPAGERKRHLDLLNASSVDRLRRRLQPTFRLLRGDTAWRVQITRVSLDGRNRLELEIQVDPRRVRLGLGKRTVSLSSRAGGPVSLAVRVTTDAAPLSPLSRNEIFNPAFLKFLADAHAIRDSAEAVRARRMERQVRAVELLSSREKLMAGLPNFATYFGRDMMMTALMMRPIWTETMSEHVIASVLRKLGPNGEVSHEEALGGQAIRENALVYDSLVATYFQAVRAGDSSRAETSLSEAREVLRDLQATRENYHMIDDEFQLPLLAAQYLSSPGLPPDRKRAFLSDTSGGGVTRLSLLLRELALVARQTRAYVDQPRATNLVSFPRRDSVHWRSASWRDSDAGYAGGRYAMDVNAIWVPQALESIATILSGLQAIGIDSKALDSAAPGMGQAVLGSYVLDTVLLRQAIEAWRGARGHFEVALPPDEVHSRIQAKLTWLPPPERYYWEQVERSQRLTDSLRFLALSLDSLGAPISVVNTDPATGLFLESIESEESNGLAEEKLLETVSTFVLSYPFGLFVPGLGPLVANDAYASRQIWERFRQDSYHGPRVVWGREVNLLLMGLAYQISAAFDQSGRLKSHTLETRVRFLEHALRRTLEAVQASGLEHNELWSYRIENGRLLPVRYGTSSDIQLWNTTSLAVQFVLSRVPRTLD